MYKVHYFSKSNCQLYLLWVKTAYDMSLLGICTGFQGFNHQNFPCHSITLVPRILVQYMNGSPILHNIYEWVCFRTVNMNGGGSIFPSPVLRTRFSPSGALDQQVLGPLRFYVSNFQLFKYLKSIISLCMSNLTTKFGHRSKNNQYCIMIDIRLVRKL